MWWWEWWCECGGGNGGVSVCGWMGGDGRCSV